jgi:hypothetical protein
LRSGSFANKTVEDLHAEENFDLALLGALFPFVS